MTKVAPLSIEKISHMSALSGPGHGVEWRVRVGESDQTTGLLCHVAGGRGGRGGDG